MKKQFNFGACKSKFLQLSCALLLAIALFSFLAAADNISPSSNIIPQNKISTSLSLKMSNNSANEQIPVIILLTNQHIAFNTVSGKSQIEHDQNNILTHLENARLQNKAQNIKSLKLVNAVAAKLSPEVITSLSKLPEISLIEPDEIISIPENPEIPDKMSFRKCMGG